MPPSDAPWLSLLVGAFVTALATALGYLVQRLNPEVQAKASQTLWERQQELQAASKEREQRLEARNAFLETRRADCEARGLAAERRVLQLEEQVRIRDRTIAEMNARETKRKKRDDKGNV
jgi:hypothetical protein